MPWRRKWQPTPVVLPEKIPWTEEPGGLQFMRSQESHTAERLSTCPCIISYQHPGVSTVWYESNSSIEIKSSGITELIFCRTVGSRSRIHFLLAIPLLSSQRTILSCHVLRFITVKTHLLERIFHIFITNLLLSRLSF